MGLLDRFKKLPSQLQFSEIASKALKNTGIHNHIEYDRENFLLRLGEQGEQRWYLTNVYNEYCNAKPSERAAILDRYVQSILDMEKSAIPDDYEAAKDKLYPGIRESAELEYLRLRAKYDGEPLHDTAIKPLTDELAKVVTYDSGKNLSFLSADVLKEWDIPYNEVFDQALDNLRRISSEPFQLLQPGLFISPWEDDHDASRLLLPELFYRLELNGKPVASIPSRGVLLVTGADDEAGLAKLAELTFQVLEDVQKPLSGFVVMLENQQWISFPNRGRPMDLPVVNLVKRWAARNYDEQKSNLEHFFEKQGIDIFVASVLLMEKKEGGEISTISVWSEGVDTLLPKTELIVIRKETDHQILVPWSTAVTIIGDYLEPTDDSPIRYRIQGFPTEEQFSRLLELDIINI
jgi:uncharacterized protein YtpQ (UPF0354 family)